MPCVATYPIPNRVLTFKEAKDYFDSLVIELEQLLPLQLKIDFMNNALPFLEKYGYFEYPASIKYHLNQEGGLLRHSVRVVLNALKLNDLWFNYPRWKVILAGLFHDSGKVGNVCLNTGEHWPRYKKCEKFKALKEAGSYKKFEEDPEHGFTFLESKDGKTYYPFTYGQAGFDFDKGRVYMDLTDLDALIPAQLMRLPADVLQACKLADGNFVPTNTTYGLKCHPLSYLIHWADFYTGIIQEGGRLSGDVYGLRENGKSGTQIGAPEKGSSETFLAGD